MVDEVILKKQVTIAICWRRTSRRSPRSSQMCEEKGEQGEQQLPCCFEARRNTSPLPRRNRWTRDSGWRWCHVVPTYQQTNSTCTHTRRVTGYLPARVSTSVQNATDDQVVLVRALVQLLQAVIASSCCRTISGLTKVLVRLAMTLHTWSRIVMRCISSNHCLTAMEYFDLTTLAICLHCSNIYIYILYISNIYIIYVLLPVPITIFSGASG